MEVDFYGKPKPVDRQRTCAHLNATYSLPVMGTIKIRSVYEPGTDRVEETERSLSWSGQIQGKCQDCGKDLWYGYSNTPKKIKRRLKMLHGTFAPAKDRFDSGMHILDPGEQQKGAKP